MTKIIELAHALGEEIAKSDEIKNLGSAKDKYDRDAALQAKMSEYEADRQLLGQEFAKDAKDADEKAIADLRARIEELTREICQNPVYIEFANAQNAMNELMNSVNAEIKFCITGERPATCTHDCSTCGGCSGAKK
ncbi:MAG: YlbF family regulator [Clostridia bacterium]|nr:YlbF family regulator [Clostridia bacterium]